MSAPNATKYPIYVDELLKSVMEEHGLSRSEVQERLHISKSLLANLLSWNRPASSDVQIAIAEAFGVSPAYGSGAVPTAIPPSKGVLFSDGTVGMPSRPSGPIDLIASEDVPELGLRAGDWLTAQPFAGVPYATKSYVVTVGGVDIVAKAMARHDLLFFELVSPPAMILHDKATQTVKAVITSKTLRM